MNPRIDGFHDPASGNIRVHDGVSEEDFVAMRRARDAGPGMRC